MQKHIEIIHDGLTMRGYHHQANSDEVVIMFHGFTGNKTETKYMFKKLSRAFENVPLDSIRMDYLGSAESDGEFKDMTYDSLLAQAQSVLHYAKNFGYKSINLLGFSMGGIVAIGSLSFEINKAVLLAPATRLYDNGLELFKNGRRLENGNVDHGGFEVGKKFLDSLKNVDFIQRAKNFPHPILIFNGKNDAAVPYEYTMQFHEQMQNSTLYLLDDCNHLFGSLLHYKTLEDTIIDFLK